MRNISKQEAESEVYQLLERLVAALVDDPRSTRIDLTVYNGVRNFHIFVTSHGKARLVGRQGRTARSIRHLMEAASANYGMRFMVQILEREDFGENRISPSATVLHMKTA